VRCRRAKRWWLENRDKNPELLEYELARAFEQIKTAPRLGIHFQVHRGKEIRYVVLPKSKYGVFYRIESERLVRVMSVWDDRRRRPPKFR
jgi:plasmid stabilization system protein ParE